MTDNKDFINTDKPRESIVFADGNYVIKKPTATNKEHIKVWVNKQKNAKNTVDNLLQKSKYINQYFVPKIIEISNTDTPYVREERVLGQPVTKNFFKKLPLTQQEKLYDSLAAFITDMNQSKPILNMSSLLQETDNNGYNLVKVLASIKQYLSKEDIEKINRIYKFFMSRSDMMEAYVFFHGDMNENNMFYDIEHDVVSFLDFAESKYENIEYMFNHDLKKLQWLDTEKLISKYTKINPKLRIKSDKNMLNLFNALRAIQWTGESLIQQPKQANIYKIILKEKINELETAYNNCVKSVQIQQIASKQRL